MGRLTIKEKEIIAYNISELRKKKYPGHGGGKKCAEAYGVPAQQWSPWEAGSRTPDDDRLKKIAKFFKVTVDDIRREPENWEEIRPEWLASKRMSKKRALQMQMEKGDLSDKTPASRANDTDMMEIMKLLINGYEKVAAGEIDADEYAAKMQQIANFARFTLGS